MTMNLNNKSTSFLLDLAYRVERVAVLRAVVENFYNQDEYLLSFVKNHDVLDYDLEDYTYEKLTVMLKKAEEALEYI